ncbi:MAG: oxidoreductase, partial [Chitinophagaceae bacterium]
ESQLSTNYLGQFQLVARLFPALKQAKGARVINVSSLGHHMSPFNFDDPNFDVREYQTLLGYGQSKTASNLFALELDQRAKVHQVRAYSLHPGSIGGTELARDADIELFKQMGFFDENGDMRQDILSSLKTIPQGAATSIWVATSPLLNDIGGVYCEDADIAKLISDDPTRQLGTELHQSGVLAYSLDESHSKRLWDLTEEMTCIKFDIRI